MHSPGSISKTFSKSQSFSTPETLLFQGTTISHVALYSTLPTGFSASILVSPLTSSPHSSQMICLIHESHVTLLTVNFQRLPITLRLKLKPLRPYKNQTLLTSLTSHSALPSLSLCSSLAPGFLSVPQTHCFHFWYNVTYSLYLECFPHPAPLLSIFMWQFPLYHWGLGLLLLLREACPVHPSKSSSPVSLYYISLIV